MLAFHPASQPLLHGCPMMCSLVKGPFMGAKMWNISAVEPFMANAVAPSVVFAFLPQSIIVYFASA